MKDENLKKDPRIKSCEMCNDSDGGCGHCDLEVAPDTQENEANTTWPMHVNVMKRKVRELRRAAEIHAAKAAECLSEANQLEKFAESGNGVPQIIIEAISDYKSGHGY